MVLISLFCPTYPPPPPPHSPLFCALLCTLEGWPLHTALLKAPCLPASVWIWPTGGSSRRSVGGRRERLGYEFPKSFLLLQFWKWTISSGAVALNEWSFDSSSRSTWGLIRNSNPQVLLQTYWSNLHFNTPSRDSYLCWTVRSTDWPLQILWGCLVCIGLSLRLLKHCSFLLLLQALVW